MSEDNLGNAIKITELAKGFVDWLFINFPKYTEWSSANLATRLIYWPLLPSDLTAGQTVELSDEVFRLLGRPAWRPYVQDKSNKPPIYIDPPSVPQLVNDLGITGFQAETLINLCTLCVDRRAWERSFEITKLLNLCAAGMIEEGLSYEDVRFRVLTDNLPAIILAVMSSRF